MAKSDCLNDFNFFFVFFFYSPRSAKASEMRKYPVIPKPLIDLEMTRMLVTLLKMMRMETRVMMAVCVALHAKLSTNDVTLGKSVVDNPIFDSDVKFMLAF